MKRIETAQSYISTFTATMLGLSLLGACPLATPSPGDHASETGIEPGDGDADGDDLPGDGDGDGDDLPDAGSGEPSPDLGGSEPATGECGDGIVDLGESCDDGNLVSGDGCASGCSVEGLLLPCDGKIWACGDGIDNDDDGRVDADDFECSSPCDDNEASFTTDIPGIGSTCKVDCFFDGDSGSGNDTCLWDLKCDPQGPGTGFGCGYEPEFDKCELAVPDSCIAACEPLVPNGCDCFGCCEIAGGFYYLDSGPACSLDNLEACESCTFHPGCNNPCEPENCELCFGQDPSELPPGCTVPECGELDECQTSAECQDGSYCQSGCCLPYEIP